MTKTNLRLAVPETPQRDDARAELRQKITDKRKCDAAVASQRAAIDRAKELLATSERRLETATAAVAAAHERDAQQAAKAIRASAAAAPGSTVHKARQAQAAQEDAVEIARGALARLESGLAEKENAAQWAANAIIVCANALLAPEAARLIEETRELRLRLAFNQSLLTEIFRDRDGPKFGEFLDERRAEDEREAPLKLMKEQADHFLFMAIGGTIEEQHKITEKSLAGGRPGVECGSMPMRHCRLRIEQRNAHERR